MITSISKQEEDQLDIFSKQTILTNDEKDLVNNLIIERNQINNWFFKSYK